jgi:hypothetical protein
VAAFLRDSFPALQADEPGNFVWIGWQAAIAVLGLEPLRPLVKEAFDRGLIDRDEMQFADFEADLRWAVEHPEAPYGKRKREYEPWTDTTAELSSWACFSDEPARMHAVTRDVSVQSVLDTLLGDRIKRMRPQSGFEVTDEPVLNPYRHVGRNDPCPCGSGRKFKKCCWDKLQA